MERIRCRIAPSPSGFLHIGTAKMALFNWLFARKTGGTFVLRLEDTDAERTEEEFVQAMCEGFHWLGIHWDEGPRFGDEPERGAYGPYRQSERRELHRGEAFRLLAEGKAYKCFATKEEIEAFRAEHPHTHFASKWRNATAKDVAAMGDAPYVVRFKVPEGQTVIQDLVQGEVRFNNTEFDDFVIVKPNGDPVFHLAVVADDAHMKITHVIRGDDHLTNAPRHVMLFEALGFPVPKCAHLPMVLDETGKKFSKRLRGANILDWREDGYLPETMINYVVLLGWSPEEENREFFTLGELAEHFSLERLSKSAARFDRKKLDWLNGQHIRNLSVEVLREHCVRILEKNGFDTRSKSQEWLSSLAAICQEKLPTLNRITELADFFFRDVEGYEEKGEKKLFAKPESVYWLESALEAMRAATGWERAALHAAFEKKVKETGLGLGNLVNPARLALTGKTVGPGFFELAELLGRETCLARMNQAISRAKGLAENAP